VESKLKLAVDEKFKLKRAEGAAFSTYDFTDVKDIFPSLLAISWLKGGEPYIQDQYAAMGLSDDLLSHFWDYNGPDESMMRKDDIQKAVKVKAKEVNEFASKVQEISLVPNEFVFKQMQSADEDPKQRAEVESKLKLAVDEMLELKWAEGQKDFEFLHSKLVYLYLRVLGSPPGSTTVVRYDEDGEPYIHGEGLEMSREEDEKKSEQKETCMKRWAEEEAKKKAEEEAKKRAEMERLGLIDEGAGAMGDPVTWFNGLMTRFYIPEGFFTRVIDFADLAAVSYRGGSLPAESAQAGRASYGDYIKAVRIEGGAAVAFKLIQISVSTARALAYKTPGADGALIAAPLPGTALLTMNVTMDGVPLLVGRHSLSTGVVTAWANPKKRIGSAYAESIHIALPGFAMRITSSKANKLADPELQVKGLHLDCEFLKFDRTSVRGPLPEMWGLVEPMSEATKALLVPPKA